MQSTRDTLLVTFSKIGDSQHRRTPIASQPNPHQPLRGSQPVPQSGTSLSRNVTRSCSPTFAGPQRWPFLAALSPVTPLRGQKAVTKPSMVTSPGPSCADTAAAHCLPKLQRVRQKHRINTTTTAVGDGRNSRSRRKNSGTAAHSSNQRKENCAAADRRTTSEKTCALTARGSMSKAMKGLVGGAAAGSAGCRKDWTTALILRSSGQGTHPSSAERAQATQAAWGGGRYKTARSAVREQGRSKIGTASLPHVK